MLKLIIAIYYYCEVYKFLDEKFLNIHIQMFNYFISKYFNILKYI